MMDPTIKAKWTEALRSGEYKQTNSALRGVPGTGQNEEGPIRFCCLGVLCDVLGTDWSDQAGSIGSVPVRANAKYSQFDQRWGGDDYLSDAILARVDLTDDEQQKLAGMNDRGNSFAYIADYIDKNL